MSAGHGGHTWWQGSVSLFLCWQRLRHGQLELKMAVNNGVMSMFGRVSDWN